MSVQFIDDFVNSKFDEGYLGRDISDMLKVSISMVSAYRKGGYNPSLDVAKHMYTTYGIVFHPFSEEALKLEISKERK